MEYKEVSTIELSNEFGLRQKNMLGFQNPTYALEDSSILLSKDEYIRLTPLQIT